MTFDKAAWRARAVTIEDEVPFHDCDPLFVVWHGRYFQYLEKARQVLLRKYALDVPDVRAMGYRMYITDARCRYMFPLSYGDKLSVTAWFTQLDPLLRVSYEVKNLTHDRRSARAYTVIATTDVSGNLLTRIPDNVAARLAQ